MANRTKPTCGRCGKKIVKSNQSDIKFFMTIGMFNGSGDEINLYEGDPTTLCNECAAEFETFMKGIKTDETIDNAKR